jgi:MFS family permease
MTSAWPLLWPGMATLVVVMGLGRFAYTPILPEMLQAQVLSLQASGWVAAANFSGYLAGALLATVVSSRRWQQHLLSAALAASILLLAAMPLTTSVGLWSVLRFVAGMASALGLIYVSAILFERLEQRGQSALKPWVYAGVSMGMASSSLVVLALPLEQASWRWNWWVMAALALLVGLLAAWGLRRLRRLPPQPGAEPAQAVTQTQSLTQTQSKSLTQTQKQKQARAFQVAACAYGLFGFAYVIHATYLPAMVRAAGYSQDAANWAWVLVGLMAIPGIAFWNRAAARFGLRKTIAACYAFEGLTALAPVFDASLGAALVAAFGLGAVLTPVSGLALTHGRALGLGQAARVVGIMTLCFSAGQILGPIVAAHLAEGAGFAAPSAVVSAALLCCSLLMIRFSADPR